MNERHQRLLILLLETDTYKTTQQLAQELSASERTIRNDLNVIETVVEKEQLKLERKKGTGVRLIGLPSEKNQLKKSILLDNDSYKDHEQIRNLLLFHLLTAKDELTLDELTENLYVSRKVLKEELQELQVLLEKHQLCLVSKPRLGTFVEGEERKKRELLVKTLRNMKKQDPKNITLKEFLAQDTLTLIQHTLREVLRKNDLEQLPELSNIDIHIYFMLERMKQKQYVQLSDYEHQLVHNTKSQEISSQILAQLAEYYLISFSPDEIDYLALRIASVLTEEAEDQEFNVESNKLADYLIKQVQVSMDLSFAQDEVLQKNLVSHLASTFHRLNFGFSISNPLSKDIFRAYPRLFLIIQMALEDYFLNEKIFIPQEEIAYLTIHFQSAIERQKKQKSQHYQTLLISEYSKAMASFFEARVKRELPELKIIDSIEFEKEEIPNLEVDFILSTVPLEHPAIDVIQISPMIAENDVARIKKYMLENQPKKRVKHLDFSEFTSPFLIFPHVKETDIDRLLKKMGDSLTDADYVTKEFTKTVIDREKRSSTQVAPLIALPHGNPAYVKTSTISIATLEKPIDWNGDEIQLVFLLAIKKSELKNSEFKKLFAVIHYLGNNPVKLNQILQSNHALEIMKQLSQYE